MDLALILILVGVAVVIFTAINGLGYFLIAAGVILVIWAAVGGRGTFYRGRRL